MFDYLKGILTLAAVQHITVEVHGIGYRVSIPFNNFPKLPQIGKELLLYITNVIREDGHELYGFLLKQERDFFETLTKISGIGPKTALALLGHLSLEDFQTAIVQSNSALICKTPGIGKKTAERLIIELKDKIKKIASEWPITPSLIHSVPSSLVEDAVSALVHLGYAALRAQKAVHIAASKEEKNWELSQLITQALRYI